MCENLSKIPTPEFLKLLKDTLQDQRHYFETLAKMILSTEDKVESFLEMDLLIEEDSIIPEE